MWKIFGIQNYQQNRFFLFEVQMLNQKKVIVNFMWNKTSSSNDENLDFKKMKFILTIDQSSITAKFYLNFNSQMNINWFTNGSKSVVNFNSMFRICLELN